MSDPVLDVLSDCGCCETGAAAPGTVNRPGLPALRYRAGTWATFLDTMIARLPAHALPSGENRGTRPLAALTTRAAVGDATLALLDSCATIADVLTFYLERYANEGFLLTATERRSVLELASAIGYQLSPGVAASTHLAFTVEAPVLKPAAAVPPDQRAYQNAPGTTAPARAIVPAGTQVSSIPGPGEASQTFETAAELEARFEWNALRPRLTVPQQPDADARTIWVEGIVTDVKAGGRILVLADDGSGDVVPTAKTVVAVTPEDADNRTRIALADSTVSPAYVPPTKLLFQYALPSLAPSLFDATTIGSVVAGQTWKEKDLEVQIGIQSWSGSALVQHLSAVQKAKNQPPPPSFEVTDPEPGIVAFTIRTSPFGHNAPRHATLPAEQTGSGGVYDKDWDASPPSIDTDSQGNAYGAVDLFLERVVDEVLPGGWALIEGSGQPPLPVRVTAVTEQSLADYAISGRATGVIAHGDPDLSAFKVRTTAIHAGSRPLALAALPIDATIGAGTAEHAQLTLDGLVLGLARGRAIALTGERADLPGVLASEVVTLADVVHGGGFTTLFFEDGLAYEYVRATVTLNANVVAATHGETVTEILGSGDAAMPNQRFTLRKPPLTYVAADTASGSASTLEVRVSDVLWTEKASLHDASPEDDAYIVRIDNDANATLTFGDGRQGARLPTGAANLVAKYRSGIGLAGELDDGALTVLRSRPLGIREAVNPVPAAGAEDPETLDDARAAAPLTVRTLDRVVSLDDYADFARAFAGVGKASASELWDGRGRIVVVTIASAGGDPVDEDGVLATNLATAIEAVRAPLEPFRVVTFQPLFFDVRAKVLVDERRTAANVLADVEAMLLDRFSFARRRFAQPVTAAEVVAAIHDVAGVVATDLDALHLSTEAESSATLASVLDARPARFDGGDLLRAELLLISPAGIDLSEMTP